jgi:hypothetical protein
MRILQAGVLYFALAFGAGFVLGPIRLLWAAPTFGTKAAELEVGCELQFRERHVFPSFAITSSTPSWGCRHEGIQCGS